MKGHRCEQMYDCGKVAKYKNDEKYYCKECILKYLKLYKND